MGLTSSTATDPFNAMLLCHVCGEGKRRGGKKLLTEVLQTLAPGTLSFRDCWPHGKYIQRLNNRGSQGPNARNLTLHFPDENIPGSQIYNEWHLSALSYQACFMSSCKKDFYYQQSILSVSIRSVNVRKKIITNFKLICYKVFAIIQHATLPLRELIGCCFVLFVNISLMVPQKQ